MNRDKFIIISIELIIFLSASLSKRFEISYYFWIIFSSIITFFVFSYSKSKDISYPMKVLFVTFIWFIIKMLTTQDGIFVLGAIWVPTTFLIIYSALKNKTKSNYQLKKFLITIFVINAFLSLYETYTHQLIIFPEMPGVTNTDVGFRSAGLLGHPLQNAMVMSIIMGFILIDNTLSSIKKYSLFLLGILAILSYNSRSSIILWGPFILIYILSILMNKKMSLKKKTLLSISSLVILSFAGYAIIYGGMGDRIFGELFDSNTNSRIEIWHIFDKGSFEDFCIGFSEQELNSMMSNFTVEAIENSFIMFILYEGYIFTFVIIYLYIKIFKNILNGYPKFSKLFVIIIFFAYANVNNSISASFFPLMIFTLSIFSFKPINNVVNTNN